MDELLGTLIPHLAGQFERGLPVLFSGAGLSLGANDISGKPVASGSEIRDALWKALFPREAVGSREFIAAPFRSRTVTAQKGVGRAAPSNSVC